MPIVNVDAIGCQKEIASKIKQQKEYYLLVVKKNQKELYEDISCAFNKTISIVEDW